MRVTGVLSSVLYCTVSAIQMGNASSTESEKGRRSRADEAAATQAESQLAHAIAQTEAAKNSRQNVILNAATREVGQMLQKRSGAMPHVKVGFAAEHHHATSFNVNAVEKGSDFRCRVVHNDNNNPHADLKIFDRHKPFATVQDVQVKTGSKDYVNRSLKHPKYEGMQKVVLKGMENPGKGYDSQVKLGPASSDPLSKDDAYKMVENPKKHFDSMRPNVAQDALNCALTGAAIGAAAGAAISTAATLVSKGTIERQDLVPIAETAVVGAVSSGAGAAVTVAVGDAAGGGIVSGSVVAAYNMLKCDGITCAAKEFVQGAAGTTAGVTTATVVCPALAATPVTAPIALVLCPAAILAASIAARKSAKAVVDAVDS